MTGDRSSGDRAVKDAERLVLLLESMAADLTGKAAELRAEALRLRAAFDGQEGDGGRRAEA